MKQHRIIGLTAVSVLSHISIQHKNHTEEPEKSYHLNKKRSKQLVMRVSPPKCPQTPLTHGSAGAEQQATSDCVEKKKNVTIKLPL